LYDYDVFTTLRNPLTQCPHAQPLLLLLHSLPPPSSGSYGRYESRATTTARFPSNCTRDCFGSNQTGTSMDGCRYHLVVVGWWRRKNFCWQQQQQQSHSQQQFEGSTTTRLDGDETSANYRCYCWSLVEGLLSEYTRKWSLSSSAAAAAGAEYIDDTRENDGSVLQFLGASRGRPGD
jgi:hypothetical protein